MSQSRNCWRYSAGCAIALVLTRIIRGRESTRDTLLVFSGFWVSRMSTTIARYIYLPRRWELNRQE